MLPLSIPLPLTITPWRALPPQVPHLLFELTSDPNEDHNLLSTDTDAHTHTPLVKELLADLNTVVDVPKVALAVAQYGIDSLRMWTNYTPDWRTKIHKGLRWDEPWKQDPKGALAAVEALLAQPSPAKITPCRHTLSWPSATAPAAHARPEWGGAPTMDR